jgi:outer membrane lipoprotein-sorting protein
MTRPQALAAFLLPMLLLLMPAPAAADPKDELAKAWTAFLGLESFRTTITNLDDGQQMATMEFQAPNRYRINSAGGPAIVIIGNDGYMDLGGRMMKVPVPVEKMTAQYRDEGVLEKMRDDMVIEDLGTDTLDGESVRKLRYVQTEPEKADTVAWISEDSGYILQLESTSGSGRKQARMRMNYSNFNDPAIDIQPPR